VLRKGQGSVREKGEYMKGMDLGSEMRLENKFWILHHCMGLQ